MLLQVPRLETLSAKVSYIVFKQSFPLVAALLGCHLSDQLFFCLPILVQSERTIWLPEPLGSERWFSHQVFVLACVQIPFPESYSQQTQARAPPTGEAFFAATRPPSQRWGSHTQIFSATLCSPSPLIPIPRYPITPNGQISDLQMQPLALCMSYLFITRCPQFLRTDWLLVELMHMCCSLSVFHQTGSSSRDIGKRPHDHSSNFPSDSSRQSSKGGNGPKSGTAAPSQTLAKPPKSETKPAAKAAKTSSTKTPDKVGGLLKGVQFEIKMSCVVSIWVCPHLNSWWALLWTNPNIFQSAKPPPAKKKKKVVPAATQESPFVDRLVYLTGIPPDATEQEVTALAGSFGKINNVILISCSEEDGKERSQQVPVIPVGLTSGRIPRDGLRLRLFAGLCLHDEEWRCSGPGQVHQPLHQTDANHCLCSQGIDPQPSLSLQTVCSTATTRFCPGFCSQEPGPSAENNSRFVLMTFLLF